MYMCGYWNNILICTFAARYYSTRSEYYCGMEQNGSRICNPRTGSTRLHPSLWNINGNPTHCWSSCPNQVAASHLGSFSHQISYYDYRSIISYYQICAFEMLNIRVIYDTRSNNYTIYSCSNV